MREIKFRALMRELVHLGHEGTWVYITGVGTFGQWWSKNGIYRGEVKHESLGQYTGLKDTNGTEIYESDLIKAWGRNDGYPCVVLFTDGKFQGKYRNSEFLFPIDALEIEVSNIKVVGNIYENPQLLK